MANESIIPLLEPLTKTIASVYGIVQVAVGGMFGLYVLLVILRWKEARDIKKLMGEIKDQIKGLNDTVIKIEKIEEERSNRLKKS